MKILSILFIIIVGTLGHFIFEWSGHRKWAGIFFAVNESTWEHIKLSIYPTVIWFFIEWAVNGWSSVLPLATAAALVSMMLLIPGIFYAYTAIVGKNFLIADIIVFVVSIIIGMEIFYGILTGIGNIGPATEIISFTVIAAIIGMYLTFSYHPLHCFLFKDPVSGGFGPYGHDCNSDFHGVHSHHHKHKH